MMDFDNVTKTYRSLSSLCLLNLKRLSDDVVAYSESGWSKIGKLKTINFQMTPIRVGKDIFVFGGGGDMMTQDKHTEIWRVSTLCHLWILLLVEKESSII